MPSQGPTLGTMVCATTETEHGGGGQALGARSQAPANPRAPDGRGDRGVQAIGYRRGRRRRHCRGGRRCPRHLLLSFPHQGTRAAGTGEARRAAHRQAIRPLPAVQPRPRLDHCRRRSGLSWAWSDDSARRCSRTFLRCTSRRHARLHEEGSEHALIVHSRPGDRDRPRPTGRVARDVNPDEQRGVLPARPLRASDDHDDLADPGAMLDDYVARTLRSMQP